MSRRGWKIAAGAASAAAAGGVVALQRADQRWAQAPNPVAREELLLPPGERIMVETDDDAQLAGTVAGDGPTVVLSHCWTGAREVWAPVAHRLLRRGHRVVLYDQRGHGSSTVGHDGFTIPRLGADLKAVLEATDSRDAVLAGHSMGGMAVQSLVSHHRNVVANRVVGIVLVATAAAGLSQGRRDHRLRKAVAGRGVEWALKHRFGHAFLRSTIGANVCRDHLTTTRDLFLACPPETRAGWLSAMQTLDLRAGLEGLEVPATITVGTRDTLTPVQRARELARLLPHARFEVHEDLGHMLPLEAPDEVADLVAETAQRAGEPEQRAS
jgi:non-heme chloroperoxidase